MSIYKRGEVANELVAINLNGRLLISMPTVRSPQGYYGKKSSMNSSLNWKFKLELLQQRALTQAKAQSM